MTTIGGYQWYQTNAAQNKSLQEAKQLVEKNQLPSSNGHTDTISFPDQFNPSVGETVGLLHIPKLSAQLPIVEGTDEDELEKGVGHYRGTAYPTQQDQIVLSGHRDTVFRRMGELEIGDILTIQLPPYGSFSYEISNTKVVPANDRSIIVPTAPNEVLTVTTCYPFTYIGNAPDRYIITALPIESKKK
ncbi:class D sortase [Virgibacillus sp. LDC-1]|uniref:class D sortase n=1 Tax=Virgibacillus sp. LDC-1 TaxID=3039856 RepID=UPI0032E7FF79